MPAPPPSLYASRLRDDRAPAFLKDSPEAPLEALLQVVWQHQRLRRGSLKTLDGSALRVLHPGFRNREAGPDFRGALVRFGEGPATGGDVEIDRGPEGWKAHGHQTNPAFSKVILHVVWETERAGSPHPTLEMGRFLDAPRSELADWAKSAASIWPEELRGQCCAPLRDLAPGGLDGLLEQAARVRLERKGREMAMRARAAGWEQALWEGLFRGLGYKYNVRISPIATGSSKMILSPQNPARPLRNP